MLRFPIDVGDFKPCDRTASAALMNGWISSIFMLGSGSCCRGGHNSILAQHVLDHLIQNFRLDWLLHEVAGTALQRRHNVFLVTDGRHHNDASFGMLADNLLGRLDA